MISEIDVGDAYYDMDNVLMITAMMIRIMMIVFLLVII